MSEEEILERLTTPKKYDMYSIIRQFKKEGIENFIITRPELIQGLLDLYNKEKEKNKVLGLDLEEMTKSNEHKKEYWVHKDVLNSYISKDKIKEKIKQYEGLKEMDMSAYEETINPLQELLEEDNK